MSSEGFKLFLKHSVPNNVPKQGNRYIYIQGYIRAHPYCKSDPIERAFAMRRAIATFNLHWRDFR